MLARQLSQEPFPKKRVGPESLLGNVEGGANLLAQGVLRQGLCAGRPPLPHDEW